MMKLLPVVVIVAILIGISSYFIFFRPKTKTPTSTVKSDFTKKDVNNIDSTSEKFTFLDNALKGLVVDVTGLQQQFNNYTSSTNARLDSDEAKLNSLQSSVNTLNSQVASLQKNTPTPSASGQGGTSGIPVYIPLGSGGSQGDRNYLSVNGYNATINPANYPGYSNMVLQVNANLVQSVGTANFQLYNSTTGQAVSGSQVSTTSSSNAFLQSGGFTIPSGNNVYQLQAQSTEGYTIQIQNASIMVNF